MVAELELTVVCDNRAEPPLLPEHGLAFWLQGPGLRLLLDSGSGETLEHNAAQLGIPLASCQHLVMSHGHYDHSGGLWAFWAQGGECPIWGHPDLLLPRYSCHPDKPLRSIGISAELAARLRASKWMQWRTAAECVTPYLGISGEIPRIVPDEDVGGPFFLDEEGLVPDPLRDDQAVWISTPRGLVILLGCCHSGLINTITHLRQVTGIQRVAGVIGGLHLLHATPMRLASTVAFLRENSPDFMLLGHCSGDEAIANLRRALPLVQIDTLQVGVQISLVVEACT